MVIYKARNHIYKCQIKCCHSSTMSSIHPCGVCEVHVCLTQKALQFDTCNLWEHKYTQGNDARRNKTALGPQEQAEIFSKLRILGPIKRLVNFHKCFISCAAECPDSIYFIQSSDKHNLLMQQGVTC